MKESTLPLPPGSFGLPLVGESLQFIFDRDFATKRMEKHGRIFKTNILGKPTVVMSGVEANKFILSTGFDHFNWRDGWPNSFRELLGESLFLQEGEEHQRNRRLLMPAFHGKALVNYVDTICEITEWYLQKWETLGEFTWLWEFKQLTFEIASIILIGAKPGENTQTLSQDISALTQGFFAIPWKLPQTTYSKAIAARDRLLAHIETVVLERQQHPTNDALGLLVQSVDEEGNRLSMEELKVQALLLLFAGHETTTSLVTFLCMALAQNPDVMAKAKGEQQAIGINTPLTLESLKQMTYLDRVLHETERLYPPVVGGFRGVVKEFEFNGYRVPEGWQVLYRIIEAHYDPNLYPEPEQFNPDREWDKSNNFTFATYGGGSRICMGMAFAQMEVKIIAALLIRRYHWELLPNQSFTLDSMPSLHPRDGLKVRFSKS
jgi:retinoid hydroxylase